MGRLLKGVKIGKAESGFKQLMNRYTVLLGDEYIIRYCSIYQFIKSDQCSVLFLRCMSVQHEQLKELED